MPQIKQIPEDFVVREIFEKRKPKDEDKGFYVWFTLKKTDWDLFRALRMISKRLGVSIKRFGHAGVKDKRAITYQKISVWNVPFERLKSVRIKDIELSDFEEKKERINLGDLKGNEFEIVIRDIDKKDRKIIENNLGKVKKGFVNYFGEQRFGNRNNTHLVGKEILKNNLKEAVWIYLAKEGDENEEAKIFRKNLSETKDFRLALKECPKSLRNEIVLLNHLVSKPNDYAGALRKIPKKFRRMFIHAYQSYLWNEMAGKSKEKTIPLIGHETHVTKDIKNILKREKIQKSDFLPKSMPELASSGDERERLVIPKGVEWEFGEDELNEKKLKCVLSFAIPKGSYATVLIREILG